MRRALTRSALLLPLALTACPAPVPPNISASLQPLGAALGPAWTIVPLPNSRLVPGTIVRLEPLDAPTVAQARSIDIVRLGSLADCAVPDSALDVTAGDIPGVSAGTSYALNADVSANLARAGVEASAGVSSTAQLKIEQARDAVLNYIRFSAWVADPANAASFNRHCKAQLAEKDTYVVQEAFVIEKGSYSYAKSTGGKLAVTPPPNVPVHAEVDAKGGPTGDLTITQPIVFALKEMQQLPEGGFAVATALHPRRGATRRAVSAVAATLAPPPPPPAPMASTPTSPLTGKTVQGLRNITPPS